MIYLLNPDKTSRVITMSSGNNEIIINCAINCGSTRWCPFSCRLREVVTQKNGMYRLCGLVLCEVQSTHSSYICLAIVRQLIDDVMSKQYNHQLCSPSVHRAYVLCANRRSSAGASSDGGRELEGTTKEQMSSQCM